MNVILERYQKIAKNHETGKITAEGNMQHLEEEVVTMAEKIKNLEEYKEKLLGVGLEAYTIDELQEIETNLDGSLKNIRERKYELLKQKIEQLKKEERRLANENVVLKKSQLQEVRPENYKSEEDSRRELEDVVTELFLGPPERRTTP